MRNTSYLQTKKHNIGVRLLRKEINEIKKGVSRYSGRILAIARDIESSRAPVIFEVIKLERIVRRVLCRLEDEVNRHE